MSSEVIELLKGINSRLDKIETEISGMKKTTQKMSDHINFVENTYSLVRTPLGYLKNKIECIMGNHHPTIELPKINNDE